MEAAVNRGCGPDGERRHVLNGIRGEQGIGSFTYQVLDHKMKYILCQNLL